MKIAPPRWPPLGVKVLVIQVNTTWSKIARHLSQHCEGAWSSPFRRATWKRNARNPGEPHGGHSAYTWSEHFEMQSAHILGNKVFTTQAHTMGEKMLITSRTTMGGKLPWRSMKLATLMSNMERENARPWSSIKGSKVLTTKASITESKVFVS